jgi:hypothetical protein
MRAAHFLALGILSAVELGYQLTLRGPRVEGLATTEAATADLAPLIGKFRVDGG